MDGQDYCWRAGSHAEMSYLIRWTRNAVSCLERMYSFLAEKDEHAAKMAIYAIRKRILTLTSFPYAGRITVDMDSGDMELFVRYGSSGYVVLYHVKDSEIFILAIRHQKQAGY